MQRDHQHRREQCELFVNLWPCSASISHTYISHTNHATVVLVRDQDPCIPAGVFKLLHLLWSRTPTIGPRCLGGVQETGIEVGITQAMHAA